MDSEGARVGTALDGDKFRSPIAERFFLRGTHRSAGMKRIKVENSTLWFVAVHAQSLAAATCPPPTATANHHHSDSTSFRDELSLLDRAKVAGEYSNALLCCAWPK